MPAEAVAGCVAPGVRKAWHRAAAVLAAVALGAGPCNSAWASDKRGHERARAAVQAGQVLPLPELLERLQKQTPGQVLELELEQDGGRWIYEVKLLQAGGHLLKLHVDAATGQVLESRRKDGPQRRDSRGDRRGG